MSLPLLDVLPDQTISIFVEAPLPGVIKAREEPVGLQVAGNLFMVSDFSAIVVSQGEDAILIGFQIVTDRIRNSLRCFIGGLDSNAKSCFTLNKCHKDWVALFADHGISLPIPYATAQIDDFRTFINGYPVLDLSTPLDAAIALASLLLTSQVGVKVASIALISIDMLVNPLGADASLIIIVQVTIDLLPSPHGSSFQSQSILHPKYGCGEFGPVVNTPGNAPILVGIRADLCYDEAPGKSSICGH